MAIMSDVDGESLGFISFDNKKTPLIAEERYSCIQFSGIKIADNAPIIWNFVRQMIVF